MNSVTELRSKDCAVVRSLASPIVTRVRFRPAVICGLSLFLVLSSFEDFSSSSPVFLPPQTPTSLDSNSTRIKGPRENLANTNMALSLNIVM